MFLFFFFSFFFIYFIFYFVFDFIFFSERRRKIESFFYLCCVFFINTVLDLCGKTRKLYLCLKKRENETRTLEVNKTKTEAHAKVTNKLHFLIWLVVSNPTLIPDWIIREQLSTRATIDFDWFFILMTRPLIGYIRWRHWLRFNE